jgi:hypothetical protein
MLTEQSQHDQPLTLVIWQSHPSVMAALLSYLKK